MKKTEQSENSAKYQIVQYLHIQYPGIPFNVQIAGANIGARKMAIAKKLGYRKGSDDIFIFVARRNKHGLCIELKKDSGTVSEDQKLWLTELSVQGYETWVCYGFEAAKSRIDDYMRGGK